MIPPVFMFERHFVAFLVLYMGSCVIQPFLFCFLHELSLLRSIIVPFFSSPQFLLLISFYLFQRQLSAFPGATIQKINRYLIIIHTTRGRPRSCFDMGFGELFLFFTFHSFLFVLLWVLVIFAYASDDGLCVRYLILHTLWVWDSWETGHRTRITDHG